MNFSFSKLPKHEFQRVPSDDGEEHGSDEKLSPQLRTPRSLRNFVAGCILITGLIIASAAGGAYVSLHFVGNTSTTSDVSPRVGPDGYPSKYPTSKVTGPG